jgi:peptidoglycan/LPS O-acetylase OafA/YrhL
MPSLDGLRAISFLLVFISHANIIPNMPGGLGIVIFFVISGFLITRQIVAEIERDGSLNLKAFYMRRVFRLAPALLAYLAFFTPVLLALGSVVTPVQVASGIFYFANYYHIFVGYPRRNPLPITWTLSVEEHYYIVYPFLMLAFRRHLKGLLPWLLALLGVALAWRMELFHLCHSAESRPALCGLPNENRLEGTDAMFDVILFGAVGAIALHFYEASVRPILVNRATFAAALLTIAVCMLIRSPLFRDTVHYSIRAFCVAVVMLNVLYGKDEAFRRILSTRPLVLIGKMSYSLYLFHFGTMISIEAFDHHRQSLGTPLNIALYVLFSVVLATLSYKLVEMPTMKFRKRFGSHNKDVAIAASAAHDRH